MDDMCCLARGTNIHISVVSCVSSSFSFVFFSSSHHEIKVWELFFISRPSPLCFSLSAEETPQKMRPFLLFNLSVFVVFHFSFLFRLMIQFLFTQKT